MSRPFDHEFKYEPGVLQDLVNKFRDIQLFLKLIVEDAFLISHWKNQFKFSFEFDEQTGLIQGISSSRKGIDDSFYMKMVSEHKNFCRDQANLLNSNLQTFHEVHLATLEVLDKLPTPLQERLSDVRGNKHWSTLVIRFCMLPSSRWPRLSSRETWRPNRSIHPKRPGVPDRVDRLLEYYSETDPTKEWQEICHRIDSFVDDIIAAAWALGSTISREPDGPCDPYTWRHEGVVINKEMPKRTWHLAKHLFEKSPSPIEFSDLAEPVFGDRELSVDYNMISNLRTEANKFFETHQIPWAVATFEKRSARLLRKMTQLNEINPEKPARS